MSELYLIKGSKDSSIEIRIFKIGRVFVDQWKKEYYSVYISGKIIFKIFSALHVAIHHTLSCAIITHYQ
jgi:hypothetical protein